MADGARCIKQGPGLYTSPGPFACQATGRRLDLVTPAATRTAAIAAAALLAAVAVGAVNGPIATGLERNLSGFATLSAYRWVHLAFATAVAAATAVATATAVAAAAITRSLAGRTAVGAATGGGKPLGSVEFLFTFGEREPLAAVGAGEILV